MDVQQQDREGRKKRLKGTTGTKQTLLSMKIEHGDSLFYLSYFSINMNGTERRLSGAIRREKIKEEQRCLKLVKTGTIRGNLSNFRQTFNTFLI